VIEIYVDADACPVKDEVYQVAARYGLHVYLVANAKLRFPAGGSIQMVVVDDAPDAADDWIADHVRTGDVTVTADIPLAARCLEAGGRVLGPAGRPFSEDSIGSALASRELMAGLRESGLAGGGPPPLSERDRSRFLAKLDELVQAGLRDRAG
jgi:uncharacterized protein YaiI (UPF0178 family)